MIMTDIFPSSHWFDLHGNSVSCCSRLFVQAEQLLDFLLWCHGQPCSWKRRETNRRQVRCWCLFFFFFFNFFSFSRLSSISTLAICGIAGGRSIDRPSTGCQICREKREHPNPRSWWKHAVLVLYSWQIEVLFK